MIIARAPYRISFFGGSTDYESFYSKHGSFIIGASINKYVYTSIREKPKFFNDEFSFYYSIVERVKNFKDITNPLIRETFNFYKPLNRTETHIFCDIPPRTGLGGSSSYCVSMSKAIDKIMDIKSSNKNIAKNAIKIEREILKDSGGIQDQIWATYGGFNTIEINNNGDFLVKPIPITEEFKKEFQNSILLVYTGQQRSQNEIAASHDNKDKKNILDISKEAYNLFLKEDIKNIGSLLLETWKQKKEISNLISNPHINLIEEKLLNFGCYGVKLLGSGGCGFMMAICNSKSAVKVRQEFKNKVLDFEFDSSGAIIIH